ncbi:sulfite exporter TauE/SafE family protein, partial [bacterium]|nr:sulfite exporter TauE/SafE family protein [bacterium]
LVLCFILWRKKITPQTAGILTGFKKTMLYFAFFLIGIYGGFVQAGVGFIIIATLAYFTPFDLIRINAIKIFVVSFYMLVSLGVFIYYDKIHWPAAIFLALGTGLGGWLGAKISVKRGEGIVKVVLVIAVLSFVCKLIFF